MSQHIKHEHKRDFNKLNDTFHFPTDTLWNITDKQHIAHSIATGGLVPCQDVLDAILAPEPDKQKRILDIGCGGGRWCLDVAKRYPHASLLGLDLAPRPIEQSLLPKNLTIETYDVNGGLEQYHTPQNQFDFIHMRGVMAGIHDFDKTLKDVQLSLKPGGLLVISGGDKVTYGEDRLHSAKIPDSEKEGPDSEGSWLYKLGYESMAASKIAGSDFDHASDVVDRGLWNHPLSDPETAASGGYFLPIGPWPRGFKLTTISVSDAAQAEQLESAGKITREYLMCLHRAGHPILSRHGIEQETLNDWSAKADDGVFNTPPELQNLKVKLWYRFRFCWARRRAGPDLPAPPLPSVLSQSTDPAAPTKDSRVKYPYFFVYHTAEEAAYETKRRNDAASPMVETDVQKAWARKQEVKA